MKRRSFLRGLATVAPSVALENAIAKHAAAQTSAAPCASEVQVVGEGEGCDGHPHSLGFSSIGFKVTTCQTGGGLFLIEHMHLGPGGPPLHLHWNQEEYFYVMEGAVAFQVGDKRVELNPGESVLAPRRIPHTFSSVKPSSRLLIAFTPAGKMEDYFRDAEQHRTLAADPEFMSKYEMKVVGPSPFWKA
jgi:mannose-6-phosphate isomerase-like protein (cupin superfamily)